MLTIGRRGGTEKEVLSSCAVAVCELSSGWIKNTPITAAADLRPDRAVGIMIDEKAKVSYKTGRLLVGSAEISTGCTATAEI